MGKSWRDLVRLGLLMRQMALDWTLSRRQRVDFGAPPQTWEQYSKEGQIWDMVPSPAFGKPIVNFWITSSIIYKLVVWPSV